MGTEVAYDEKTNLYSIWSTITDSWIAEDVRREHAKEILLKRAGHFYNMYAQPDGCVICEPQDDGTIMCFGTGLNKKYKSCAEQAKFHKPESIAVSKPTYMNREDVNNDIFLNNAQGYGKSKKEFEDSLIRIDLSNVPYEEYDYDLKKFVKRK